MKRILLILSALLLTSFTVFWAGNRYGLFNQQLFVGDLSAATVDTGMINMCRNQTGQVHAFLSNTTSDGVVEIWLNTDRNNAGGIGAGGSGVSNTSKADAIYMYATSTQKNLNFLLNTSTGKIGWYSAQNGASEIMRLNANGNLIIGNGYTTSDAGDNKFLQIGKVGVPLGTTQGTKMLLYYDTAGSNANVVGRVPFSDLSTILGANYILNQSATAETKTIRIGGDTTGFIISERSSTNNNLRAIPGGSLNTAIFAQNVITDGGAATTTRTSAGFYAGLSISNVPNMTSPSGFGHYGFISQLSLSSVTFSSTPEIPASANANLAISNTTMAGIAAIRTMATFSGTNSITNYFQLYLGSNAGSGTKPGTTWGVYQEDPTALNQFLGVSTRFTNYYSISTAPAIAAGAGAGTGASVTAATGATNAALLVTVVVGTTPSASAAIATITFSNSFAYPNAPAVSLTPRNEAAATLSGSTQVYATSTATTATLMANSTQLPAGTYIWNVTITK